MQKYSPKSDVVVFLKQKGIGFFFLFLPKNMYCGYSLKAKDYPQQMSQCMTKPSIRPVRTAKTQISLCICAIWSESLLIACAFCSLWAIQWGINKNHCPIGWVYRLTWVFAGHTGLIEGFVLRCLICFILHTVAVEKKGYQVNIFLFLYKNIHCGHSLELPWQGASNKSQNIHFW